MQLSDLQYKKYIWFLTYLWNWRNHGCQGDWTLSLPIFDPHNSKTFFLLSSTFYYYSSPNFVTFHHACYSIRILCLLMQQLQMNTQSLNRVVIWAGIGPTIMAAQQTGLKAQECQRNLYAIYIGRNQNSIDNIA